MQKSGRKYSDLATNGSIIIQSKHVKNVHVTIDVSMVMIYNCANGPEQITWTEQGITLHIQMLILSGGYAGGEEGVL